MCMENIHVLNLICFITDTLSQEYDPLNSSHVSFITKCSTRKVTRFITQHVRTAYMQWETAQEIHYILPFEEAKKGNFEKLFQVCQIICAVRQDTEATYS